MWKKDSSEGSDRFEYLQTLVTEFQDTDSVGRYTFVITQCSMFIRFI